jgi:hypothetical protein
LSTIVLSECGLPTIHPGAKYPSIRIKLNPEQCVRDVPYCPKSGHFAIVVPR